MPSNPNSQKAKNKNYTKSNDHSKSKNSNTNESLVNKTKEFFKHNEYPRYMLKLVIIFLGGLIVLSVISILMGSSLEEYDYKIDKSYIKEIFNLDGIDTKELDFKDMTKQYSENIIAYTDNKFNEETKVYSVLMDNKKIGWSVKVFVDGYIPNTHCQKYTKSIREKMVVMVGVFIDSSLAGIRVMRHQEPARLTYSMEDDRYLSNFASDSIKSMDRKKIIKLENLPKDITEFEQVFGVNSMSGAEHTSIALIEAIKIAYKIITPEPIQQTGK